MRRCRGERHSKVDMAGGILDARLQHEGAGDTRRARVKRPGAVEARRDKERAAAPSGDQAQLTSPGDGLGAVGRAELAQDVTHALTVSRVTTSSLAMAWFDLPRRASSALPAAAGQWIDDDGHRGRVPAVPQRRMPGVEARVAGPGSRAGRRGRPAGRWAATSRPSSAAIGGPRRRKPSGNPAGRRQRPGQGGHRPASSPLAASARARSAPISMRLLVRSWAAAAACSRSSSTERLPAAPGPAARGRAPDIPARGAARFDFRVKAALLRPALGAARSPWASSSGPLGRDGVDQSGRAQRGLRGLAHRLQRTGRIAAACRIHASVARPLASGGA